MEPKNSDIGLGSVSRSSQLPPRNVPIPITKDQCESGFLRPNINEKLGYFSAKMVERYNGPMPAKKFVQAFLPTDPQSDKKMPTNYTLLKNIFSEGSTCRVDKKKLIHELCEFFNSSGRCPDFTLDVPTGITGAIRRDRKLRPDICLYNDKALENAEKDEGSILGCADLFMQVRLNEFREDPFEDPTPETDYSNFNFVRNIYKEMKNEEKDRKENEDKGNKENEDEDDKENEGEGGEEKDSEGSEGSEEVEEVEEGKGGEIEELKEDEDEDDEDDENYEDDEELVDAYTRNRGEIAAYAAELCARQFRTHCFSVSIYGTKVRFFRWDRAGVIISRSFDILENSELLCQFMWRYANATDAQRGYDTSVTQASHEEEKIFARIVRNHVKEQLSIEDSELDGLVKEHYEPNSVFKMPIHPRTSPEVDSGMIKAPPDASISEPYPWDELWREVNTADSDNSDSEPRKEQPETKISSTRSKSRVYTRIQYFLVSRPVVAPLSISCRGTRGYWAVKIPDESVGESEYTIAFVKDTWREVHEDSDIEGNVIVENIEAGVKFVSDIFCHGNVIAESLKGPRNCHLSRTGRYKAKEKWNCNENIDNISRLRHYRMASVEVGYPLSTLRGTKELVHGVRCAFLAAWAAYVLRRRLHRDISANNIILVKKGKRWRTGILIDWELSSTVAEDGKAKDSARAGTWAFMSIALLRAKGFKHRFQDDMESFYYMFLYSSILWLPREELKEFEELVADFFDECRSNKGITTGGKFKVANIVAGTFEEIWVFGNALLQKCLDGILNLQRPFEEQPSWKPQSFYAIFESVDEDDLPLDDRTDHIRIKRQREAERKAQFASHWQLQSPDISEKSSSVPTSPSVKSETSGKRNANEAGLEENEGKAGKRACRPIPISR